MTQSDETDPCASLLEAVEDIERRIAEDRIRLTHPEDLTAEQGAEIQLDLEQALEQLVRFQDSLDRCREQNSHSERSPVRS